MKNKKTVDLIDPICGMQVTEASDFTSVYQDKTYFFCSKHCLQKFQKKPENIFSEDNADEKTHNDYTCPMHSEVEQAQPGSCHKCGMALEPKGVPTIKHKSEFTCPMQPEIVQDHPGSCPKCGMALDAMTISTEESNEELVDMSRRLWISSILAIPVFILAMIADMIPSLLPVALSMKSVQWIEFSLATPVVFWGGWPFYVRGVQSIKSWNLNMFTLIGLGVSVAWLFSVVALLFPNIFPEVMVHQDGTVSVYFESAAVITALVLLGQVLELRARSRTNAAIKMLLGLAPNTARIVYEDGTEKNIPL